jgi:hypothetical protein
MVERGVGATYITERELGAIRIPTLLGDQHPGAVAAYREFFRNRDVAKMMSVERRLRSKLIEPIGDLD